MPPKSKRSKSPAPSRSRNSSARKKSIDNNENTKSKPKGVIKKGYIIALKEAVELDRIDKVSKDFPKWSGGCGLTPLIVDRPTADLSNMDFPIFWQTRIFGVSYYIGCGNSHRLCWQKIADEKEDGWYMIMESDVMIDFENAKLLGEVNDFFNNHVPLDADIVALGNLVDLRTQTKWDLFKKSLLVWFTCEFFQQPILIPHSKIINDYVKIPFNFCGAHGYALSPTGARKLLDRISEIRFHVDYEVSAAVGRDPSIRLYSSRFNVFRQSATIKYKKPTYPMFFNNLLDNVMCFDMSAAWNLTLPICYVPPVVITAWSIPLALCSVISQVVGLYMCDFAIKGYFIGWFSNILFWCLVSLPFGGHWNQFFQQLYLTVCVGNVPMLTIYSYIVYQFVKEARIFPPYLPNQETYSTFAYSPRRHSPQIANKKKLI